MHDVGHPPVITDEPHYDHVPASSLSAEELADIYNQTRIDYIVPMPMNAKRMQSYIRNYDINLDDSPVIFDSQGQVAGLGMLGLRGDRGWITRLGVIPERRGRNMGLFLMRLMIDAARRYYPRLMQLEVIQGNIPAHSLFVKLGFRDVRDLLVIRRPPAPLPDTPPTPGSVIRQMDREEVYACLSERSGSASWVTENASLVKLTNLQGIKVRLSNGYAGWVVYQLTPFEISHVVTKTPPMARNEVLHNLLYALHHTHPEQDTKIENLPLHEVSWPVYQQMGYIEMFRRVEMELLF